MIGESDFDRGLYKKYFVQRLGDYKHKHDKCDFFVLDLVHDKFAAAALRTYATMCELDYPELARDLRKRITREPSDQC